jgi:hypothetical protein
VVQVRPNARNATIATYQANHWVLVETVKVRADLWLRFQCAG